MPPFSASRGSDAAAHKNRDGQVRISVMSFEKILHRPHHGHGKFRAVLNKPWLIQRLAVLASDGEFDAFHPHIPSQRISTRATTPPATSSIPVLVPRGSSLGE